MTLPRVGRVGRTWKEKQRTRVPCVDLDDNPFCLERRVNEELHTMQLNRNPSLAHLTSADVRRTASFVVDDAKPFRDFSRKKRNLLAWSLRSASASEVSPRKPAQKATRKSSTVPLLLGDHDVDVDYFFAQKEKRRRRRDRADVDVDTMPTLEPYRREVVAQQPTTFGHRPVSASRMFNPSTMATTFTPSGGDGKNGSGVNRSGIRRREAPKQKAANSSKGGEKARRAPRLSAPMLKELLLGNKQRGGGLGVKPVLTSSMGAGADSGIAQDLESRGKGLGRGPFGAGYIALDSQEELSETSNGSLGSVDPEMLQDLKSTWLTSSSETGPRNKKHLKGGSIEETELRRIFHADRPPWDETPAPLPAPREVRRAVSSLLMPDPDERLRDKLVKSRKAAAGIPVTASSIKEEKERSTQSETSSGRWEVPPATPRMVIARDEVKRLVEGRRERDSAMARRVRQAELSVFYNKILPSEKRYRDTLARGLTRFKPAGA